LPLAFLKDFGGNYPSAVSAWKRKTMEVIDLRSDTVTHPTPKMRHAMMEARVGDDVWGDDPTVIELQNLAAKRFGREAGLFVPSGTMGNAVCFLSHCARGERAIMGDKAHSNMYEAGNPAVIGGIQPWTLPVQQDGTLRLEDLEAAVFPDDPHFPYTTLVSLENTQNATGGQPLSAEYTDQVGAFCHRHGFKLHIDGARIFNAAAALGTDVATLTTAADSVTFCLSKGLCAPVGSVVVGSEEFIQRAYRMRKVLGGAMRQAGVVAAAGIIALEEMTERLSEDHAHAKMLAEGLARIPAIEIAAERVKTNMVYFNLRPDAKLTAPELSDKLRSDNVLLVSNGTYRFRAVTHYWIKTEHIELVLKRIAHYLS
jgi:threonine aldolase